MWIWHPITSRGILGIEIMFLVPGQVKCIRHNRPCRCSVGQMQKTWCYPIFGCQRELILFLQSEDIRDMMRKWFTATKAFMACNVLPITRSRQLFIINVRERKLKEEKKQLAMNRNKKAVREKAHSHRLMHIWHNSAAITVLARACPHAHNSCTRPQTSPPVIVASTASPKPLFCSPPNTALPDFPN